MTRINVIDPSVLTDQHLMAEYRELPMVMAALRRSLTAKRGIPPIPPKYTLNKGHVTFFYNKGLYLRARYAALIAELVDRGYDVNPQARETVSFEVFDANRHLDQQWLPDSHALMVNQARVTERINQKLEWYKHRKLPITGYDTDIIHPTKLWSPHD